jgi:hypothetical protein
MIVGCCAKRTVAVERTIEAAKRRTMARIDLLLNILVGDTLNF